MTILRKIKLVADWIFDQFILPLVETFRTQDKKGNDKS